jgi:UDP-N-acetylglucosamine 2-epimerase (non-hydrolysing)/GDP/UDP-N,N'-diacetylbacillosamine 2-epimerase (hydrolysing)
MKRKICVITGTRAEYGIYYPVLEAIESSPSLELYLIVTGMHLMKEFGFTVKEIEKSGFNIYQKVDIVYEEDSGQAMAFFVGRAIIEFSKGFTNLKPDIVVILGDRGEMLAAAVAGNYMNIPIAHIHGGEVSGHVDGLMRHAITKLAHLHFPATPSSRERLIKMGEEERRVFLVGAPGLDHILNLALPGEIELRKKYSLNKDAPLVLLVQHPVSTQSEQADRQIQITLEAITELKLPTLVVYPNADAGGRKMIKVINKYEKKYPFINSVKSAPRKEYLGLMRTASVLVGNSSSGIIEAPSFKLPVVNIGIRQEGREKSTNVIDVPHDKKLIAEAIKKALFDKDFLKQVKNCINPYGDGRAGKRIAEILARIKINSELLQKKMTY